MLQMIQFCFHGYYLMKKYFFGFFYRGVSCLGAGKEGFINYFCWKFLPLASLVSAGSYQFTLSSRTRLSLKTFTEANEGRMSHTIFLTEWVSMIPIATTGLAAATHSVIDPFV